MNNPHTARAPTNIRIWQQNARKSIRNTNYILNTADPSKYDLILIQEPWFDHLGKTRGTHNWRIVYPPTIYHDNHDPIRSIILVNTNLSTNMYTTLDIPCGDISAIRLQGDFGHCSIFNIYNDCTNNNTTTALRNYLTDHRPDALPSPNDHMLWLGDFNRHHPLWEPNNNRHLYNSAEMINPLLDLITEHNMIIALPPDIPTYETVTSNWTRPDNVWRNENANDPIIICNVDPFIRPPQADHLPIVTELDLSTQRANAFPTRNMREADFKEINKRLQTLLHQRCPARKIRNKDELESAVNKLVEAIQEVLEVEVPASKPCPYTKRWWTKELTELKQEQQRLSKLSYRFRGIPNHPVHADYKNAANKLNNRIDETKREHWTDWLENASSQDIYTANKYVNSDPSDYSSARIPPLKTRNESQQDSLATENMAKAEALAETFFPPPPRKCIIPDMAYPRPLKAKGTFTRDDIRAAVQKLQPYKAPGEDGIQNIVIQKCIETIIDHLYYIYRAVLELDAYPSRWLIILTIVLRKAGKPAYNVAKAYRPIGLLDTLGKLFSVLVAGDLSYLAEKHGLLPPTQFGGRPGRCTTDAMHLVVQKIKDAWRAKKVASILFLDIQAAFPNTVKERLIHNMKSRRVPTIYIRLFERMLSDRQTRLRFDDFLSDPIQILNGTTQGCPLSMLLYAFYNAELIEIACGKNELATGFVDDCAFVAVANSLEETHTILKDMMERPNGGLDWSRGHNSQFEISKLAVMDFPRPHKAELSPPLIIDQTHPDGTTTSSTIALTQTYKYLGVIFDPKLTWRAHITKVIASATRWTQQLWRVSKTTGGLSPCRTRQLYNTVAVPAFTYASDIWYIPPYKQAHSQKSSGSVADTKSLQSIQGTASRYITGGIRGTAYDVLEAHANLPPIDLLFRKIQFRAATRICALPSRHPLYEVACRAARRFVKTHRSPLHHLFFTTGLKPQDVETIDPVRRHPNYRPALKTVISNNKESALISANENHAESQYKVYCDGSGFEGGAGASAVLYKGNRIIKSLRYHLGPLTEHTVYESELIGLMLALHLLIGLTCQLLFTVIIGIDNQAAIRSLMNQKSKPAHYLLDKIHDATERLHQRQDQLQNKTTFQQARRQQQQLTAKSRNVVDLQIHWVPGHLDFSPNDKADELAKDAAAGNSSLPRDLPAFLRKPLPVSVSALRQESKSKIQRRWARRWKTSPRCRHMGGIDKSVPSKKWMSLVKPLSRRQASLIMQLRTGQIGLNKHLHRIRRSDTPYCPNCNENAVETIHHFLFDCARYRSERSILHRKLRRRSHNLSYLLSHPAATLPLLKYVHSTGRLKQTFGALCSENQLSANTS